MTDSEMEKRVRKAKRSNYIVFTVFVVLLLGIAALVLGYRYKHNFSSAKWERNPEKRTDIVDDLLSDYDLIGKTREEINSLLGEESRSLSIAGDEDMVYCLGPERGFFSIDDEWLILVMENDVVSSYYITTD